MDKQRTVSYLLRLGLAFVFIYAGIASFVNPSDWIGFFPLFLRNLLNNNLLLIGHSAFEVVLGLWLLTGKWPFYSSVISAVAIFGIIIFNLGSMDIIFRDVAILFMALSLVLLSYERISKVKY